MLSGCGEGGRGEGGFGDGGFGVGFLAAPRIVCAILVLFHDFLHSTRRCSHILSKSSLDFCFNRSAVVGREVGLGEGIGEGALPAPPAAAAIIRAQISFLVPDVSTPHFWASATISAFLYFVDFSQVFESISQSSDDLEEDFVLVLDFLLDLLVLVLDFLLDLLVLVLDFLLDLPLLFFEDLFFEDLRSADFFFLPIFATRASASCVLFHDFLQSTPFLSHISSNSALEYLLYSSVTDTIYLYRIFYFKFCYFVTKLNYFHL